MYCCGVCKQPTSVSCILLVGSKLLLAVDTMGVQTCDPLWSTLSDVCVVELPWDRHAQALVEQFQKGVRHTPPLRELLFSC